MGLRINTNITAINAQRNLANSDNRLFRSVQRLSSGLKINSSADSPAGLAISEQLRAQIAGLNAAIVNSERAINLVQTAEGALNEVNSLLISIRELALDAANSGVQDANSLAADQAEVSNAIQTITRISDNTQFGIRTVLDGSNANVVTSSAADLVGITALQNSNLRTGTFNLAITNIVQATATITSTAPTTNVGLYDDLVNPPGQPDGLSSGNHTITVVGATGARVSSSDSTTLDGIGTIAMGTTFAIATASGPLVVTFDSTVSNTVANVVAEINDDAEATLGADQLQAINNGDGTFSVVIDSANTSLGAGQTLTVAFVDVLTANSFGFSGSATQATDISGLNARVRLDDGDFIDLDPLDATFVLSDQAGGSLVLSLEVGAAAFQSDFDASTLNVVVTSATFDVQLGSGSIVRFDADETHTVSAGTSANGTQLGTVDITFGAFNIPTAATTISLTAVDNSLQFQVGANANQTVNIAIRDISADTLALGIQNTSNFRNLAEIDITSTQGANDAIGLIDAAINEVTSLRATLGAFQKNTLESNLQALRITSENLAASESTIRDVDISKEITEFTRNQILLSAGVSVLAQANAIPQTVLQLLG